MNTRKLRLLIFPAFLLLFWGTVLSAKETSREAVNHDLFDQLLEKHVKNGVVDYKGLKQNETKLEEYLGVLEMVDPEKLSRNDQFAFFINAYNAWTIKLILTGYPGVKSIKELGSFFRSPWKKKICRIGGEVITLDDIEHAILRPRFKDPRIHFAVNCASKDCPPLRKEAYRGSILDKQLDDATKQFLNDPKKNYLDGKTLYVSEIFEWFGDDFDNRIVEFFLRYAQEDLKKNLLKDQNAIEVKYLDYDWSLNGR